MPTAPSLPLFKLLQTLDLLSPDFSASTLRNRPFRRIPNAKGNILQFPQPMDHPSPTPSKRQFGRCLPILPRVRRAVIHPRRKVSQDCLSSANERGKCPQHLYPVPLAAQFVPRRARKTVLQHHVAPAKRELRKTRSLQRRLKVHLEVRNIRKKLRMRLRLIPPSHNPKRHPRLALLRKS